MSTLIKCRKLFCFGNPFSQTKNPFSVFSNVKSNGISSNIRRMYHQYKPKDRPTIHETTNTLDPLISRDILLYRHDEPFKVRIFKSWTLTVPSFLVMMSILKWRLVEAIFLKQGRSGQGLKGL